MVSCVTLKGWQSSDVGTDVAKEENMVVVIGSKFTSIIIPIAPTTVGFIEYVSASQHIVEMRRELEQSVIVGARMRVRHIEKTLTTVHHNDNLTYQPVFQVIALRLVCACVAIEPQHVGGEVAEIDVALVIHMEIARLELLVVNIHRAETVVKCYQVALAVLICRMENVILGQVAAKVEDGNRRRNACGSETVPIQKIIYIVFRYQRVVEIQVFIILFGQGEKDIREEGRVADQLQAVDLRRLPIVCMKNLLPDNIALRRDFHDARVGILRLPAMRRERQQFLSVDGGAVGKLPGNIKIALRIGDGADDVVPILARRFLAGVRFHPVEMLGVGGEGQHDERRQQNDSLDCFHFEYCFNCLD